jgi:hypothetical protein
MPDLWLRGAQRRPIPQGANDPNINAVGDVFHIAVSELESLYGIFTDGRGIESTGYIRRDGSVEQYRPYNVECDAQAAGNSWHEASGKRVGLCSWESQGMGEGEWTDDQVDTIKRIIRMRHTEWGVPLRVCPTAQSSGFGYHRLFAAWNPNAHSCPGDGRVRQFNNVIVPWMEQGAPGGDWFDMATEAELRQAIRDEVGEALIMVDPAKKETWQLERVLRALLNDEQHLRAAIGSNADRLVQTIVDQAPVEGTITREQFVNAVEVGVANVLRRGVGA